MTDQQRKAHIAALITERQGYAARGLEDRVAAVDAELERIGAAGAAPAQRSTKRAGRKADA